MIKKKGPKKKPQKELTLWDVVLSYPDLHDPKPYKGKVYYSVDAILERNDPQVKELKDAINEVCVEAFGDDESEWPKSIVSVQDGNEREDQQGYAGKRFIKAKTQGAVPVVDLSGKAFNPQSVKGGMYGNVAINISTWEYDGDQGVSIYLQGVQIDTKKKGLNFGGGRTPEQMFNHSSKKSAQVDAGDEDDQDDEPRGKKSKKSKKSFDEEE
jgi:hypothetical protein